jgi:hypothetical protein
MGAPRKTHCNRGHERTPENIGGSRRCMKCNTLLQAKYNSKRIPKTPLPEQSERGDIMNFLTIKQASEKFPAFSQNSIRWIVFNSATNGANKFLIRVGRKVLIDGDLFVEWVNGHREV